MPLGPGVRYRVKRQGGKKIRLAFRGNKVIEVAKLRKGKAAKVLHREGCKK